MKVLLYQVYSIIETAMRWRTSAAAAKRALGKSEMLCGVIPILVLLANASVWGYETNDGAALWCANFDTEVSRQEWTKHSQVRFVEVTPGTANDQAVNVDIPKNAGTGSAAIQIALPLEKFAGSRVRVSARVKAEKVEKPEAAYNGVDIQLHVKTPSKENWYQKPNVYGSFDWQTVSFAAEIPRDVEVLTLSVGLEKTTGQLWADDLQVEVISKYPERPARKMLFDDQGNRKPVYTGHDVSRLRGAMISPHHFGPEDLRVFAQEWKGNHVRWQMNWGFPNGQADTATIEQFQSWIDSECELLDKMLPLCREYGVAVCLDLHTSPGGRDPAQNAVMFLRKDLQDAFVAVWIKLATKYKDEPAIWGYDLLNEPTEPEIPTGQGLLNWRDLAEKTAKAVREIDAKKPIIVEPAPWGGPEPLDYFEPINVSNVVYSVHMYLPHRFTHQGVYDNPVGFEYPGTIDGVYWDKEALREALRPAIEFQEDYGVAIYIGEFSAIRWAPNDSAQRYLKDVIELFEEYEWDWAYHAYREWSGWSVEHTGAPGEDQKATSPTGRELLLRSWFEKNERAEAAPAP
ncbi:MAG: cellulase family glycosylhydrolase [Planctomycetia bacterium]|nr:cellulase family glycosylhydrolase [Planctomycetia bacterium]